jgi:ribosomal protein S18 acetylase RimI-like enzyme
MGVGSAFLPERVILNSHGVARPSTATPNAMEAALALIRAPFRRAEQADASLLAELVNYAGEGLPHYLWGKLTQADETAWDVGRRRAAREDGSFSYRNAVMIEHLGECAGCLIGYEIPDVPEPIAADMPAMFKPLQELENLAPATWYVNVLAVVPQFRGKGLGTELLRLADETGRALGKRGMSVIVSDGNTGARRLYERCGYGAVAARAMVKDGWVNDGNNWVLLTKQLR